MRKSSWVLSILIIKCQCKILHNTSASARIESGVVEKQLGLGLKQARSFPFLSSPSVEGFGPAVFGVFTFLTALSKATTGCEASSKSPEDSMILAAAAGLRRRFQLSSFKALLEQIISTYAKREDRIADLVRKIADYDTVDKKQLFTVMK